MKTPALIFAALVGSASAAQTPIHSHSAASAVIERYYAAVDRGDYRKAYNLWDNRGRTSGKTLASFATGFAKTAHTAVVVGQPHDEEGAAGSIYITVPVTVRAQLKDGKRQAFKGSYVLRYNNVTEPGQAPAPWFIYSATLKKAQ